MSKRIRVGIIGYGYWGPNLVRNFDRLSDVEIVYIADKDTTAQARARAQYPDIPVIGKPAYGGMFEPDAVVIATPVASHYSLAVEALEKKKHVFVEKPMAMTSKECNVLNYKSGFYNARLMVGHTFLFSDVVRYIKQQIDNAALGNILHVRITRTNLGLFRDDVNVAWDLAAHDIAMLNYFFEGSPRRVDAIGSKHYGELEDVAYINLGYSHKHTNYPVNAHIHVSWLDPKKVREVVIVGSDKMLVYDDLGGDCKVKIYDKGVDAPPYTSSFSEFNSSYRHGDITIPRIPEGEPLANEAQHFIECIQRGCTPLSDGKLGMDVVSTLEQIDDRMRCG